MGTMRIALVALTAACGTTTPPRDADRSGQLEERTESPRTDAGGATPGAGEVAGNPPTATPPPPRLEIPADPTAASPQPADQFVATVRGSPKYPSLRGTVTFRPSPGGVQVESRVDGLPAGPHGYHVHVYGDCSDPAAKTMGAHLDFRAIPGGGCAGPMGSPPAGADTPATPGAMPTTPPTPGGPGGTTGGGEPAGVMESRIHGNLGQLTGGKSTASGTETLPLSDEQLQMLVGRAVVIHAAANDEGQPPDGGAGDPIACGVIGVANRTGGTP
jgi:superoxide dismutase, Cu-Zn family